MYIHVKIFTGFLKNSTANFDTAQSMQNLFNTHNVPVLVMSPLVNYEHKHAPQELEVPSKHVYSTSP